MDHVSDDTVGVYVDFVKERATGQTAVNGDIMMDMRGWFYNDAATPELVQGTALRSVVSDIVDGTEEARFEFWSRNTTLQRVLTVSSRYGINQHFGNFNIETGRLNRYSKTP